jgi:hypothetical protein
MRVCANFALTNKIGGVGVKTCKGCEKDLELSSFGRSKVTKDGYEGKCRECRKAQRPKHAHTCDQCKTTFHSDKKSAKYCGAECQGLSKRKRVVVRCLSCDKSIEKTISQASNVVNNFCNHTCYGNYQKTHKTGVNNSNFKSQFKDCDGCGKKITVQPFKSQKHKYHFCSKDCYTRNIGKFYIGENNHNFVEPIPLKCCQCGGVFKRRKCDVKGVERVFCSKNCHIEFIKSGKNPLKRIKKEQVSCPICDKKFEILPSYMSGKKRVYCSRDCKNTGVSIFQCGENNGNYNPNISDEERLGNRLYREYVSWRLAVYKRDSYTCVCCKDSKGGNLNAHHIDGYNWCVEKRTDVDNGVTLCETCHGEFHGIYGYGDNTHEQYNEWIRNKR